MQVDTLGVLTDRQIKPTAKDKHMTAARNYARRLEAKERGRRILIQELARQLNEGYAALIIKK